MTRSNSAQKQTRGVEKKCKTLPRIHKNKTKNLKVWYRDNRKTRKLGDNDATFIEGKFLT